MGLLDKATKLAKSEKAQEILHKVEEKAKDPELRAKVQGVATTVKDKTLDTVEVVRDKAEDQIQKRRSDEDAATATGTGSSATASSATQSPAPESGVTPAAAAEPHDGRSADQRNLDETVDPTAGPEGELPG